MAFLRRILRRLGVWINRECIREAFKEKEVRFNTLNKALGYIGSRFNIGLENWVESSVLLKDALYQERLTKYTAS